VIIILNWGGGDGVVRDHYIELGRRVWCSSCSLLLNWGGGDAVVCVHYIELGRRGMGMV